MCSTRFLSYLRHLSSVFCPTSEFQTQSTLHTVYLYVCFKFLSLCWELVGCYTLIRLNKGSMVRASAPAITVAVVGTRILAAIQLLLGITTFAIGVASISILTSTAHFADQYGLGLFAGVFICLAGFVGMFSSFNFNNRSLCLLNFFCNIFIWFKMLVSLVLFGLAADYYERMRDAKVCLRIQEVPRSAYFNRQDYDLRLKDPICLAEQKKMAPDGYIFSLCLAIIFGLYLFIGVAAIVYCCKALYGMCGGTTPRVQTTGGQRYGYPVQQQQQNPVNYSKGYEMKSSGVSSSTNEPPPAYKPQNKSNPPTSSTAQSSGPKKADSSAAPSYFL